MKTIVYRCISAAAAVIAAIAFFSHEMAFTNVSEIPGLCLMYLVTAMGVHNLVTSFYGRPTALAPSAGGLVVMLMSACHIQYLFENAFSYVPPAAIISPVFAFAVTTIICFLRLIVELGIAKRRSINS